MKKPHAFILAYVAHISTGYMEAGIADTAKLFGVDEGRLAEWSSANGLTFNYDCIMGETFPAIWRDFASVSGVCAEMWAAYEILRARAAPGSDMDEWVKACEREELMGRRGWGDLGREEQDAKLGEAKRSA